MSEAVSNATVVGQTQPIEQRIKEHAQKNFSLTADQITVGELKTNDLPSGVRQFYVEKKGATGNLSYQYLVWNNQIYCSGVDDDFGKFLKDYGFLQNKNLDANQLMQILRKLKNYREMMPITEADLKNDADLKPFLGKISAPSLVAAEGGGALFTFFTQTVTTTPIQKFEVKISPSYQTTFSQEFVMP